MINLFRRLLWTRQLARRVADPETRALLLRNRIIAARISGPDTSPSVSWPDDGIVTNLADERFVLEAHDHLQTLKSLGGKLSRASDGRLLLAIQGMRLAPGSAEEFLIATEIFHAGVYHFSFARPVGIIDIGANVCTASLAFANNPLVRRVHAYEPLPANLALARANLTLNPELAQRIDLRPWGLGADSRLQEIEYDGALRGSASVRSGPDAIDRLRRRTARPCERARVEIRPAADAVDELAAAHPDCDLWAKIDCEGAEDEILPALAASGRLTRLRGLVMETHQGNGAARENDLLSAGFTVWRPDPHSTDLGYLLAFRP